MMANSESWKTLGQLIDATTRARIAERDHLLRLNKSYNGAILRLHQLEAELKAECAKRQLLDATVQAQKQGLDQLVKFDKLYAEAIVRINQLEGELKAERAKGHIELVVRVEDDNEESSSSVEEAIVLEKVAKKKPVSNRYPYYCPHCAAEYDRMQRLRRHIDKNHAPLIIAPTTEQVPQKERAQEPDPTMEPSALVGKRVSIWRSGEGQWFSGTVKDIDASGKHVIHYDDGEVLPEYLLGASTYPRRGWRILVPVPQS
jgi:hypothetical protein